MTARNVIGIDFGTTNSYFCTSPGDREAPEGIVFSSRHPGLETAILLRDGQTLTVGHKAVEQWGVASDEQRRGYRLHTQFKPDIAIAPEARQCAVDFLAGVQRLAHDDRIALAPAGADVIVGVPAEADDVFSDTLAAVFDEAGYGRVRLVPEPVGALAHHLRRKDISPLEAYEGVLVIDFGGGTCDFTLMREMKPVRTWGSMRLGGRLFDDLFFQWAIERKPGLLEQLVGQGREYYVHWSVCRQIKEAFSDDVRRAPDEPVTGDLRQWGFLEGLTRAEFVDRARAYRAHPTFVDLMRARGFGDEPIAFYEQETDLIDWFRRELLGGRGDGREGGVGVQRVILTGGSSQWFFVADILERELDVEPDRVKRSNRPLETIGAGLAALPAMKRRYQAASAELRRDLDAFVRDTLRPELGRHVERAVEATCEALASRLFARCVREPVRAFCRQDRFCIADLKQELGERMRAFQGEARTIVEERTGPLRDGLPEVLQDKIADWFGRHDIHYGRESMQLSQVEAPALEAQPLDGLPNLAQTLADAGQAVAAAVVAVVVAAVCGGTGMALLMSGPVGLMLGALIGALGAAAAIVVGKDKVRETIESRRWPRRIWMVELLSETRAMAAVDKAQARFKDQLRAETEQKLADPLDRLEQQLRARIDTEIGKIAETADL